MASPAVEPVPHERPTEAREEELSGSGTLGFFRALGGNGESTALMAIAEEYEGNDVFGKIDCSIKLLTAGLLSIISTAVPNYGTDFPTTYGWSNRSRSPPPETTG